MGSKTLQQAPDQVCRAAKCDINRIINAHLKKKETLKLISKIENNLAKLQIKEKPAN